MIQYQQTIKSEITLEGVGLHTGLTSTVIFCPAPPKHGIQFERSDLPGDDNKIYADCDLVTDVERSTTIEKGTTKIATVEHILAAVAGLEIDNIIIKVSAAEIPILDGSAKPFVAALKEAGIHQQNEIKEYFTLTENIEFYDEEKKVKMLAIPSEEYQITSMIDFNSKVLGSQHASFEHISEFSTEFADARTFCFLHELEYLLKNDLIKGGDLNNAIVVVDKVVKPDELKRLAKMFNKENIEVKQEGILNNIELRYANEPARHKLLDIVGDLALIGTPLKAKIIASRPGHKTNVAFAKKIKAHIKEQKKKNAPPSYDPNKKPLYATKDIMNILPHASPMLLVDKIIELTDTKVVAIKNVTYNEPFFRGHFPSNPIMPGVLIIEAMAQAGGILALNTVDEPNNYETYFMKIEKARFKSMVVPGDTLVFALNLMQPIRRGICEMKGTAYVGNNIVTEAILMAQIAKVK